MIRFFTLPVIVVGLLLSVVLCLGLAGVFIPFSVSDQTSNEVEDISPPALPVLNRLDGDEGVLSSQSPFVIGHEPYLRPVVAPTPAPPPVRREIVIELVGIVSGGGEPSAIVLLDGVEHSVQLGDDTEAGRVVFVGPGSVRFEGDGVREVSLFD